MGCSYHNPRDTVGSLRDCDCHPCFLKELKVSLIHCKDEEYNWNLKMQWRYTGSLSDTRCHSSIKTIITWSLDLSTVKRGRRGRRTSERNQQPALISLWVKSTDWDPALCYIFGKPTCIIWIKCMLMFLSLHEISCALFILLDLCFFKDTHK